MSNNNYEFIKKLGSGSQGTVWKAIRLSDNKTIAVKILKIYNDKTVEAAADEVKKLKSLATPKCNENIVCYYGYSENPTEFQVFVEMEYIEGEDLSDYSKKFREKDEYSKLYKHLLLITKDLIKGILYIHDRDIIHSDIKPANIMIDKNLTPKIIDFGVSCHSNDVCKLGSKKVSCCKGLVGSPAYASPEVYKDEIRYPQSDIWSLGMTLYEAATGKYPYIYKTSKPNLRDIFQAIQDEEPIKLETSNILLNDIVNKSLVKDPKDRITAIEINNMLKNYK